jgi:hypothetical protein
LRGGATATPHGTDAEGKKLLKKERGGGKQPEAAGGPRPAG